MFVGQSSNVKFIENPQAETQTKDVIWFFWREVDIKNVKIFSEEGLEMTKISGAV